jgi:hypothetical protein
MVVAVAVAALIGSAATARAESGAMIGGGRLALNYSTLYASYTSSYSGSTSTYTAGSGGLGVDAGLVGRLAVVEGQMGVHVGANFIYRSVYNSGLLNSSDMAVGVPILFEINPFVVSGLNSSIYEMIFLQIGLQVDYTFSYSETYNGKENTINPFERNPLGVGIVVGAVGYFNSHLSLDIRWCYGVTEYYDLSKNPFYYWKWYPYTYNIGLSFYL